MLGYERCSYALTFYEANTIFDFDWMGERSPRGHGPASFPGRMTPESDL